MVQTRLTNMDAAASTRKHPAPIFLTVLALLLCLQVANTHAISEVPIDDDMVYFVDRDSVFTTQYGIFVDANALAFNDPAVPHSPVLLRRTDQGWEVRFRSSAAWEAVGLIPHHDA